VTIIVRAARIKPAREIVTEIRSVEISFNTFEEDI
jgi:hypothetical protein